MIKSIHFQNFKALRDATLPLGRFTLIVGPNGSGKSTAMQGFDFVFGRGPYDFTKMLTAGLDPRSDAISVMMTWEKDGKTLTVGAELREKSDKPARKPKLISVDDVELKDSLDDALRGFKVYAFDAKKISSSTSIETEAKLNEDGFGLANVLDDISDQEPERFDALNKELHRWIPEFDRILFERPTNGSKAFQLRTTAGHFRTRAADLSQGTLIALALLTVAYLRDPPSIVCFEEPDHGLHPRLLKDLQDAMYRLAFPENYGEKRQPVQVIATTHSPYLLDLFKNHPEQIVIAHKDEAGAHFEHLSERPYIAELLDGGAPLGEIWYSGILGGVPASP